MKKIFTLFLVTMLLNYYWVNATNSSSAHGAVYLKAIPYTAEATTACSTPSAQPTALVFTPGTGTIAGSFTASVSADHYLVVRSTSNTLGATPTGLKTYNAGDTVGTIGTVISYQPINSFTDNGPFVAGTQYYYYIFAANSNCTGGPLYLTVSPLTGSSYTSCVAPTLQATGLILTPSISNSITGIFNASSTADYYLIVKNTTGTAPSAPVNGVTYSSGNQLTGSTFVAFISSTTFTDGPLTGSNWFYFIYAANKYCSVNTPMYLTTNPLKGTVVLPITASGNWTCPTGVTSVTVQIWGTGGGGGATTIANSTSYKCGGGGGGAYSASVLAVSTTGGTSGGPNYPVAVYATGGAGASGANGSPNFFKNQTTAKAAGGTGGGINNTSGGAGGQASASVGNVMTKSGGNGGAGGTTYSGSGGGAAGPSAVGGNGGSSGTATTGGVGGATNPSTNNGGNGGASISSEVPGIAGISYGGGGGGAYRTSGVATAWSGGTGAGGLIIITPNCVNKPSNLTFVPGPANIAGTFTASPDADHYLIVRSSSSNPTPPIHGVMYSAGNIITGIGSNDTVVAYQTGTSFNSTGLNGNTHYYFYIYSAKTIPYAGWATYDTTATILSGNTYTSCTAPIAQPTVLNLTPAATSISGSFIISGSADNYLIVKNTTGIAPSAPVNGVTYSSLSPLAGSTFIAYQSGNTFTDNGLVAGTMYYYYIYAANSGCTSAVVSYLPTSPLTGSSYTLCVTPSVQPTALTVTPTSNTIAGAFTAASGADHYLVVRSTSNTLSANPANATTYTTGSSLGGGKVVVYQTGTTFTDASLNSNTHYYYYIFAANSTSCSGGPVYFTTSPLQKDTTTLCGVPAAQPISLLLTPTSNTVSISFTPSATADNYLIFRSTSPTFSSSLPVNNSFYSIGNTLGGLDTVIAYQSGTSFTDTTALISGKLYYYFVFGCNASCTGGPIYLTTSPLTNYTITLSNTPCTTPTNPPSGLTLTPGLNSIVGSFTAAVGGADYYLIIRSTSSTLSAGPHDDSTFTAGISLGGGTVVSYQLSSNLSFTDNGLNTGTHYYYYIYSTNAVCTGGPLYSATSLNNNTYTNCALPSAQPTNLVFTTTTSTISGHFKPSASADHYLTIRSTASSLSASPANGSTYTAGGSLGGGTIIANVTDTTFTDNGPLTASTQYYYYIFALNSSTCTNGPIYLTTSPLTSSTYTHCPTPVAQPTNLGLSSIGTTTVNISFTAPTSAPDHYLILRSTSSSPTATPLNGTAYVAGNVIGNDTVVSYQTTTSYSNTGLTSNVQYYYFVYSSNSTNCSVTTYLTTSPLLGSITTAQMQVIPIANFTADVVMNGNYIGTNSSSSTGDCDDQSYALVANDYTASTGTACAGSSGLFWPLTGGTFTSLASPGPIVNYTVQPATSNNAFQVASSATGTLNLTTPVMANNLYLLYFHATGSTVTLPSVVVNFTDGSSQTFTTISVPNWCTIGSTQASNVYNRALRTASTCGIVANPYLQQMTLAISAANQSKFITSITFNNTAGKLSVFALSGAVITPQPCATPANQPTGLTFNTATITTISGSFTASAGLPGADHYLVVKSANSNPTLPVNGSIYTIGQVITGTGTSNDTVIAYQTSTSISDTGLRGNTTHYYYIYAANSGCSGTAPMYLTTSPLTGNSTTVCPATPTTTVTPASQSLCYNGTISAITAAVNNQSSSYLVNSPLGSAPANTFIVGTNTTYSGTELHLTENVGSTYGAFYVNNPNSINSSIFSASFQMSIYPQGADGISFNYGGDLPTTLAGLTTVGSLEKGIGTGLSVCIVTYGGATIPGPYIYAKYGGTDLTTQGTINTSLISTSATSYVTVTVNVSSTNQLVVTVAGTQVINVALPTTYASANKSSWIFNISARCGGVSEQHYIRNAAIQFPDQYKYSFNGGTTYQTTNTYTPPLSTSTYPVYVSLLDGNCPFYAGTATVTLLDTTKIISSSLGAQTQCINGTFTPISVTASGANLTYQWYRNTSASTSGGTSLGTANGATTNTYTPQVASTVTYYYYCLVTGTCGVQPAKLSPFSGAFIVNPASVGGTATATLSTVCYGSGTTITLTGYTGTIQWQQSSDGSSGWADVTGGSGATTATYTTPNLTAKTYYRAVVTSGVCSSANSTTALVKLPTPTAQPSNLILAPGTTTVSGSFTASSADHYLIVRSTSSTLSATPLNGTIYNANDPFGGGVIISYQTGISISDAGLSWNTIYYYYIFAANNTGCSNGPVYLPDSPLTDNTKTSMPLSKTLNVTAMLQGYYDYTNNNDLMLQTQDVDLDGNSFNKWSDLIVDTITVQIRSTIGPDYVIEQEFPTSHINTNGTIVLSGNLPYSLTGYHYIVVKHWKSIQTWSDSVSFSTSTINYNFYTNPISVEFPSNMTKDVSGVTANGYLIYGGDITDGNGTAGPQDGYVTLDDMFMVYDANLYVLSGYEILDINGDGYVTLDDMFLVYDNNLFVAQVINPITLNSKKKK